MTYEEAIIILRDTPIDIRSSDDIYTLYATAQGMAIDALEKQIPKKPTRTRGKYGHTECACCGEWISVKDRLPEDRGYYLVAYRDKYNESISVAYDAYVKCSFGEWWESEFTHDISKRVVTHWMPLPEPPKENNYGYLQTSLSIQHT